MIDNVKHHKQLPVYGEGMQIRAWLYVEDHCKTIDRVVWQRATGEDQGSASAEGYSIAGVALNLSDKDKKWLGLKDAFTF